MNNTKQFAFFTVPKIHLVYPPPPPKKKETFYILRNVLTSLGTIVSREIKNNAYVDCFEGK